MLQHFCKVATTSIREMIIESKKHDYFKNCGKFNSETNDEHTSQN